MQFSVIYFYYIGTSKEYFLLANHRCSAVYIKKKGNRHKCRLSVKRVCIVCGFYGEKEEKKSFLFIFNFYFIIIIFRKYFTLI